MFRVEVAATTANLGPGYDVLGMAISKSSIFEGELAEEVSIEIEGLESQKLTGNNNLVQKSMERLFREIGRKPKGYRLKIINGIPLARGMGSSAAAIVGGLVLANALMGFPLEEDEILNLATEVEGHPDNVAPALFGDLIVSTKLESGEVVYKKIKTGSFLDLVLFIPEYELSTEESRSVLPELISMEDVVKNSSNLGLLILGFIDRDKKLISEVMEDRIHEPYRQSLIKGFDKFKKAALDAGAISFSLSGAGPSVIAYCDKGESEKVRENMQEIADIEGIDGRAMVLQISTQGAICQEV